MKDNLYTKYFKNRNETLKNSLKSHNSSRVFETFLSALSYFDYKTINKQDFVVDLGCGDRSFVKFIETKGIRSRGIDIDDGINFEFDQLPLDDNSVDHIISNSVIEHINNPEVFLKEVKRILKNDGNFILVTPNFKYGYDDFYDDPTHVKPYTDTSIQKLLEMFKFKKVKVLPWFVKKPNFYWKLPKKFLIGKFIPFRGDAPKLIPEFLKGQTKSMLVICKK